MCPGLFSDEASCGSVLVKDHLPEATTKSLHFGGRLREVRLYFICSSVSKIGVYHSRLRNLISILLLPLYYFHEIYQNGPPGNAPLSEKDHPKSRLMIPWQSRAFEPALWYAALDNRESNMADKKSAFLVDYAQLHNVHVSCTAENPKEGSCARWRE